jgi:hypothetical protein
LTNVCIFDNIFPEEEKMRYITLTAMVLLLSFSTMRADVVFHEEFGEPWGWWGPDNPPTGWQINHYAELGGPWYQNQDATLAQVETGYPSEPLSEDLFKDDIDCADYENLELSFWFWIDWWDVYYPGGTFLVYGSNDQFNDHCITLLTDSSPDDFSGGTLHFDISEWADGQATVGVWFRVEGKDLDTARVDSVHIEGDYNASVQASSLGKIKAIFL